ncbi:MAG: hypothetical protein F4Z34_08835 [Acidimicrobiaceae bacterium]|nr:6-phosphogluconolactonase [Acidimicrobiaceae bacterium]MXZ53275.1 hypothetical protein [Acidimicrobiaceae bacterium]
MTVGHRRFDSPLALGAAAAAEIAAGIVGSRTAGRPYLLGCPGGRTPKPVYAELGRICAADGIDCSGVVLVMMDDYLDPGSATPEPVSRHAHNSCRRFAEQEIRLVINRGLTVSRRVPQESVWFPDPLDPAAYDRRIADAGGVEVFITASGASDGHVAFCGPGSDIDGASAIVELAPTTRADNVITFPDFASVEEVPTHGVSVGLGTIRGCSRSVWLMLHGADKAESLRRVLGTASHDPAWPATFIHECPGAVVWSDASAERGCNP